MTQKFSIFILSRLVMITMLVACGSSSPKDLPATGPDEVVGSFYNWYLGEKSGPPKDARESSLLSSGLVERLDKMLESPVPSDMINFVCAQDFPDSIKILSSEIDGENAAVLVESSFGGTIQIDLLIEGGEWRIADVSCR